MRMKPAIVLAAFGASAATTRLAYRNFEAAIRRAYPECPLYEAYTSRHVIQRAREHGEHIPSLDETAAAIRAAGHDALAVLPLLTIAGEEYNKVAQFCWGLRRAVCAAPLLAVPADVTAAVAALKPHILPEAANIVVCHGNRTYEQYNAPLLALARAAEAAHANCVVASIEGLPGTAPLERARSLAQNVGRAHFIPFMIVAGQHVTEDVMGKGEESWKNRLGAEMTTCAPPLAWNAEIVRLYVARLEAALARLETLR
jgi:sirohydrochlorin cobaltochelatase